MKHAKIDVNTAKLMADAKEYIADRYTVDPETGCWNWTGAIFQQTGYGVAGSYRLRQATGKVAAHTLSYFAHHGPYPKGLYVLHSCDNRPCCNPDHLRTGTARDNRRDMDERGRANPHCKLTDSEVRTVRSLYSQGLDAKIIATAFDISLRYVYYLARRTARPGVR